MPHWRNRLTGHRDMLPAKVKRDPERIGEMLDIALEGDSTALPIISRNAAVSFRFDRIG
jgi:hypothetical protein